MSIQTSDVQEIRYIKFKDEVIVLHKNSLGFWVDKEGTIYALSELKPTDDVEDRCGVGAISTNKKSSISKLCKKHDYMYSSPVYQYFHTREEADRSLLEDFRSAGRPIIGRFFYCLARIFGGVFWEGRK